MTRKAVRLTIHGRVQGVGFRYYTLHKAQALHITGWVKNQYNSTVLVEAEGESPDLDTFVDWCHLGPPRAQVQEVQKQEIPVQGWDGFVVRSF
ncbi:MAG: acylphosphatase [Bacteroidales bacterium]|jgi:acylphosphatase